MIINTKSEERLLQEIAPYLAPCLRKVFENIPPHVLHSGEELRLGRERPVAVYTGGSIWFVSENGALTKRASEGFIVSEDMLKGTIELLCNHSVYAVQEQLTRGFITISGGHRIGMVGYGVYKGKAIEHIKDISSINIRFSREVRGCADGIIEKIANGETIENTLLISPPGCGKTTLLRDIARQLGGERYLFKVGIVDERCEIAACEKGTPKNNVGFLTDVISNCSKTDGMEMMLRSMAPHVLITDEIGTDDDARAISQIINAGVKIIASAHGYGEEDLRQREGLYKLSKERLFKRIIVLSRRNGPGTIERIISC